MGCICWKYRIIGCGTIFPAEKRFFRWKNDLAGSRFIFPLENWFSGEQIHFSVGNMVFPLETWRKKWNPRFSGVEMPLVILFEDFPFWFPKGHLETSQKDEV